MAQVVPITAVLCLAFAGNTVLADDKRARFNFQIHCQGCHLPDAAGFPGKVPRIKNFLGFFLHAPEGREYLLRVPGVSTAMLPDDELAELMNWLVTTYSADQMPDVFVPFTASEVAANRGDPEADPGKTRQTILENIATTLPSLAEEMRRGDY